MGEAEEGSGSEIGGAVLGGKTSSQYQYKLEFRRSREVQSEDGVWWTGGGVVVFVGGVAVEGGVASCCCACSCSCWGLGWGRRTARRGVPDMRVVRLVRRRREVSVMVER